MNMTVLMGYLGTDPYKIDVPGGKSFGASFKLATNEKMKIKGEYVTRTDWHKVNIWGQGAEYCIDNLSKGSKVLVEGRIRNSDYVDKDGVKHYSYEIFAKNLNFISKSKKQKENTIEGESVLDKETL